MQLLDCLRKIDVLNWRVSGAGWNRDKIPPEAAGQRGKFCYGGSWAGTVTIFPQRPQAEGGKIVMVTVAAQLCQLAPRGRRTKGARLA
jgi:hypothetical protein